MRWLVRATPLTVLLLGGVVPPDAAEITITARLIADDVSALCNGSADGRVLNFVGRNEAHPDIGNPGTESWSVAEAWALTVDSSDHVLAVAWAPPGGASKFIGDVASSDALVVTNRVQWQATVLPGWYQGVDTPDLATVSLLASVSTQEDRRAPGDKGHSPVTNGQAGKGMTVQAVINAIVEQAPTRLSALEKVLGALQRDRSKDFMQLRREIGSGGVGAVEVDYAIDIHHKDPREVEDPDLARYSIAFESGLAYCLELLEKKHGAARTGKKDGRRVFRFDTAPGGHPTYRAGFYVYAAATDAFILEWRTAVPDLAFSPQTAGDVRDLEARIIDLLGGALNRTRIQSIFGVLTKKDGWNTDTVHTETWVFEAEPAGADRPERFTLSFTPSMDAAAVIEALGVKKPVVVSKGNVHLVGRVVVDYESKALPEAGGYRIELNVVDEGLKPADLPWGYGPVWRADGCRIQHIEGTRALPR